MTIPTLTTLPVAPARTDPPATFVTRADAFLAAIVTFQGEMNTSIGAMNTDIAGVNADAIAAAASASSAASSATAAANAAGASLWVSGQAYAEGDAAISGVNYQTYRAETATSGTTDPSLDANWTAISGTFPVQTGNADKFLTTDGTTPSWADLPASGGSADFVATGAITAGQTVGLRSDGTIEVISGATGSEAFGAEVLTGGSNNPIAIYDSVNNKVIAIFNNGANAGSVQVGTVSGQTITFASSVQFATNYNAYQQSDAVYDPVNERVAIFYRSSVNGRGTAIVGQVIGTTMTFGSEVEFDTNSSTIIQAQYDAASGNILVVYDTNGSLGSILATISGTSISFGTLQIISYSNPDGIRIARDNANNKYYVAANGGTTISLFVVSISGSTITAGAANSTSQYAESNYFDIAYDENAERLVYLYRDVSSNSFYIAIGTISGDTITLTSGSLLDASNTGAASNLHDLIYNPSAKKTYAAIRASGQSAGIYELTINNTAFTSKRKQDLPTGTAYGFSCFDPDTNQIIYYYQNESTGELKARTYSPFFLTTNANSYIGLAAANISNAATGTINILGGTNASQSGLTVGGNYWLDFDGTLSASKTNYAKIGYATAADTIVLSANSNESTAITSGGLYLPAANNFSAGDLVFSDGDTASSLSTTVISPIKTVNNAQTNAGQTIYTPLNCVPYSGGALQVFQDGNGYVRVIPIVYDGSSITYGTEYLVISSATNSGEQTVLAGYNELTGTFWIFAKGTSNQLYRCYVVIAADGLTLANYSYNNTGSVASYQQSMAIDGETGRILVWSGSNFHVTTNTTGATIDYGSNTSTGFSGTHHYTCSYAKTLNKFVITYSNNPIFGVGLVTFDGSSAPSYSNQANLQSSIGWWSDDASTACWSEYHQALFFSYLNGRLSPNQAYVIIMKWNGSAFVNQHEQGLYTLFGSLNYWTSYYGYNRKTNFAPFDDLNLIYFSSNAAFEYVSYDGASTLTREDTQNTYYSSGADGHAGIFGNTLYYFQKSSATLYSGVYELAVTNYKNFVGFAKEDVSTGGIAKIDTASAINTSKTGLTTGTNYYVNSLGQLSTTDSGYPAGKALSSTNIMVKV